MSLRRLLSRPLLICVALLAGCQAPAPEPGSDNAEPVDVRLIAINDFHGNLLPVGTYGLADLAGTEQKVDVGGAAYLASLVEARRATHAANLVVAAGDLIGASPPISGLFHDEPTIEVLSEIGLQVSSLGNHEFDEGLLELQRMQNGGCRPGGKPGSDTCFDAGFPGAKFEYLAANVVDAQGEHPFPASTLRTVIDEHGRSVRIGLIGAVLRGTRDIVDPTGIVGLSFLDEADAVNAEVPALRAAGADAIVLLIHEGGAIDGPFDDAGCKGLSGDILPIMARLDPAVRVVISGHTHKAYTCELGDRLLTSGGAYGRFVTTIDLAVDPSAHALVGFTARNEPVINDRGANPVADRWPALAPDDTVATDVATWSTRVAPISDRVVGHISEDLLATPGPGPGLDAVLGGVIADAQWAAMKGQDHGAADFAVMNPGGIRSRLDYEPVGAEAPGEVTWGELFAAQPFGNTIVTVPMTGQAFLEMLESQFAGSYPKILSVSSNVSLKLRLEPQSGPHVVPGSVRIDGQPLDAQRVYRVAMNNFIANGGDGYRVMRVPGGTTITGPGDLDALLAYFAEHDPVRPPPAGRVLRVD